MSKGKEWGEGEGIEKSVFTSDLSMETFIINSPVAELSGGITSGKK